MINTTSVWIQWKPPSPQHCNGVLLGYKLSLLNSIEALILQDVMTNASNYVFSDLVDGIRYRLQVGGDR